MNPKKFSTIPQSQFNHHTMPVTPFKITSLQVNKEKLLIGGFSLLQCFSVSMLFESLVEIKIESRLYCINI